MWKRPPASAYVVPTGLYMLPLFPDDKFTPRRKDLEAAVAAARAADEESGDGPGFARRLASAVLEINHMMEGMEIASRELDELVDAIAKFGNDRNSKAAVTRN